MTPLRLARAAKGWSQRELARRAGGGLDAAAISDFERGRSPSLRNAQRLATALGVSLDALWSQPNTERAGPTRTPTHRRARGATTGRE